MMAAHVNEVLCFMKNKIKVLPHDTISKLCTDFYSDEEILKAKEMLFATAFLHLDENDRPRLILRRGENKRQSDVEDMLKVFLTTAATNIPSYAAVDLFRIPPVGLNSFDLSTILRDVETLKEQMCVLQEVQKENLKAHSALCAEAITSRDSSHNPPVAEQAPASETMTLPKTVSMHNSDSDSSEERATSDDEHEALETLVQNTLKRKRKSGKHSQKNHSTHAAADGSSNPAPDRPPRDTIVRGQGRGFALKATARSAAQDDSRRQQQARQTTGIFVTRLARSMRPSDVVKHVRLQTGMECQCEPLITRHDSYRSFCIRCPAKLRQMLMNASTWPKGVLVREYKE